MCSHFNIHQWNNGFAFEWKYHSDVIHFFIKNNKRHEKQVRFAQSKIQVHRNITREVFGRIKMEISMLVHCKMNANALFATQVPAGVNQTELPLQSNDFNLEFRTKQIHVKKNWTKHHLKFTSKFSNKLEKFPTGNSIQLFSFEFLRICWSLCSQSY